MRQHAARRLVLALASRVRGGQLTIEEAGRSHEFGDPADGLRATVTVHSPRVWPALLTGGLGLGRSYSAGWWDTDDLVALTRICARSFGPLDEVRRRIWPLLLPFQAGAASLSRIGPGRARRNAAAHYDLGNDLYRMFLDESLTYSSAVFLRPGMTLEQAQEEKLDRACRRIGLRPEHSVVEIGTGWGSFAVHAALRYRCSVLTTTLATEQHALASERVAAAGLGDRVEVVMQDYRALRGRFDRLVSIEMVEAVGWRHYDEYFEACSRLLVPDGAMLIQAILLDDRWFEAEKRLRSFANTLIFPGGCLPSVSSIARSVGRVTDMRVAGLEDITPHYAQTLRQWRQRFLARREEVRALGYDEEFLRLWEMYLAFSEGGFRERRLRVAQIVLAKPEWRGERGLLAAEDPRRDEVDQARRATRGELPEREDPARSADAVPLLD
jgi:cyclopropane-fatty-acyl-phospholipid synthase